MSNFLQAIDSASKIVSAEKKVEVERLAELVEDQVSNVLGGGYSQYSAKHYKEPKEEEVVG